MKTLIIVDVQNDFCPGGALAVPAGDVIVPGINKMAAAFDPVVTTQDWHPANHGSFAANHPGAKPYDMGTLSGRPQVLWPTHCVQGTVGAAFHPDLRVLAMNFVKGTDSDADSYSGFFDDGGKSTGLHEVLSAHRVSNVFVCGLATDYCVKFTVLDAIRLGYRTSVIEDLCRAVNLNPGDEKKALDEMRTAGATVLRSESVIS